MNLYKIESEKSNEPIYVLANHVAEAITKMVANIKGEKEEYITSIEKVNGTIIYAYEED